MTEFHRSLLYAAVSMFTVFLMTVYKISHCSLYKLCAYMLPEQQHKIVEQPSEVSDTKRSAKNKKKDKSKFVWDEGNSEILIIHIADTYLNITEYFREYDQAVLYAALGFSVLGTAQFVHLQYGCYVSHGNGDGDGKGGPMLPVAALMITSFCVLKLISLLIKVSWENQTGDSVPSVTAAVTAFFVAVVTFSFVPEHVLDLGLNGAMVSSGFDTFESAMVRLVLAVLASGVTFLLFGPAVKVVRSFWIGTNQLGWDVSETSGLYVMKIGAWTTFLFHLNVAFPLFTVLLWFKPMSGLFIRTPASTYDWSANFGVTEGTFEDVKFTAMVMCGIIELLLLRANVQSYLHLGILKWYETLHGSRAPDMQDLKNKLIVLNYFMCRVAVQCFVPAVLVILLAGISQPWSSCGAPSFLRQVVIFISWWTVCTWAVTKGLVLALFRCGFMAY